MFFVWMILHGSIVLLARYLAQWTLWATPLGLLISTAALVAWLLIRGKRAAVGLQKPHPYSLRKRLPFLLLLLPVAYNLISGNGSLPALLTICTLCLGAILEEVVFRGIILHFLRRWGNILAILASAALFALSHIFNQGGIDPYQIIFAFAAGVALAGLTLCSGSLFPAMEIHLLINFTAGERNPAYLWLFIVSIAAYLFCGTYSIILLNNANSSEKG